MHASNERDAEREAKRDPFAARKNLPPIHERLDLVEREMEILTGNQGIAHRGTHLGIWRLPFLRGGEELLYVSDTLLHPFI